MRHLALFATCVAAATGSFPIPETFEEEIQPCDQGWFLNDAKRCFKRFNDPKTWYQAESYCRKDHDAHLASAETLHNRDSLVKLASGNNVWFGLKFAAGNWEYSNGQDFLNTRNLGMVPKDWSIPEGKLCAAVSGTSAGSRECSQVLPFVCSKPAKDFFYEKLQLGIYGADFGEMDSQFNANTLTTITSEGLVIHSGSEVAIGKWISEVTFQADHVSGTDCTWVFTADEKEPTSGCILSGRTTAATWAFVPKYTPEITDAPQPGDENKSSMEKSFIKPTIPTPKPSFVVEGGGDFYPTLGAVDDGEKDDKIPTWVWPVAFGGVVAVAVLAAVGGARNKKKKKSPPTSDIEGEGSNSVLNSSEEERSDGGKGSSEAGSSNTGGGGRKKHRTNISPENCETCKKFNEEATRARLYQVHRELANELRVPLQITGIHCDHTGSDHVHIFNVENEFTSYTLGVLSTCYSRVKPRLPKNTRIHIVHKKERQTLEGGADFLGDYDYYGAQYF